MQDTEPHGGSYVIKLCGLKGSFSAVPVGEREKPWQEFFLIVPNGGVTDQRRKLNINPVRIHQSC
jgi:hypothetical protein